MSDQLTLPVPCLKCGKQLKDATNSSPAEYNQPYAGTAFTTNGHYGSTVFDPFDPDELLEIVICDDCMKEAAEANRVLRLQRERQKVTFNYSLWRS